MYLNFGPAWAWYLVCAFAIIGGVTSFLGGIWLIVWLVRVFLRGLGAA